MKISRIRVDRAKVDQGVKVALKDYDERFDEDVFVNVRALNNPSDRALQARQARELGNKKATFDQEYDFLTERLVKTVLVGWGGFVDDDEKPIPYSEEQSREWLGDRDWGNFREAVIKAAADVSTGVAKIIEDHAGNSRLPSTGSSGGESGYDF